MTHLLKKKNPSRKLPTATHSKLSRQNGGKGISPVEILASPKFHSGRDCRRASGARAPAGGRERPAFCPAGGALRRSGLGFLALLLPVTYVVSSSRKVAVVGFSPILWLPHYPTQLFSYTADGLTFNTFPKGMREGIELF